MAICFDDRQVGLAEKPAEEGPPHEKAHAKAAESARLEFARLPQTRQQVHQIPRRVEVRSTQTAFGAEPPATASRVEPLTDSALLGSEFGLRHQQRGVFPGEGFPVQDHEPLSAVRQNIQHLEGQLHCWLDPTTHTRPNQDLLLLQKEDQRRPQHRRPKAHQEEDQQARLLHEHLAQGLQIASRQAAKVPHSFQSR